MSVMGLREVAAHQKITHWTHLQHVNGFSSNSNCVMTANILHFEWDLVANFQTSHQSQPKIFGMAYVSNGLQGGGCTSKDHSLDPFTACEWLQQHQQLCHDYKQLPFWLRLGGKLPNFSPIPTQNIWHGLSVMGFKEVVSHQKITHWTHLQHVNGFSSTSNCVMTANSSHFDWDLVANLQTVSFDIWVFLFPAIYGR
jgi:hypothetical protein